MICTATLNPSLDEWIYLSPLRFGEVNRSRAFARYAGGKGIDVSRVVHELGGATRAYAIIGGEDGRIFKHLMEQYGVPCAFEYTAGLTRNNYKLQVEGRPGITEINNAGPRVTRTLAERLKARILALKRPPASVVLAGSLPPGLPKDTYARWVRAFKRQGLRVMLDTSGEALHWGAAARPFLIKPNQHEISTLVGRVLRSQRQFIAAAQALIARDKGPENVIVSMGKHGALLIAQHDGVWQAEAPPVKVDSTVGCGDSLVAGVAWGLANRRPLPEAFRIGVAAGSACAMTSGTELCYRKDVWRLFPKVRVQRVA